MRLHSDTLNPQSERRLKVLVVDDDPAIIQALYRILGEDYEVRFALSGAEALKMIDDASPDLLLLDIEMPGMSGMEVCRQLKLNPAYLNLPVLFVTGHTDTGSEIQALYAGGSDFIQKPLVPELVKARVHIHATIVNQSKQLRKMAYVDGLTGLFNRRKFDEALEDEWRWCRRRGVPLSLLLLDIDLFKFFNDQYGHLVGDRCLQAVATAARSCLRRSHDLAARYGGEEFAFLLPDTNAASASQLAEDIRTAIATLNLPHAASTVADNVTVSLGVASVTPADGDSRSLLRQADMALYEAKRQGRNRVFATHAV